MWPTGALCRRPASQKGGGSCHGVQVLLWLTGRPVQAASIAEKRQDEYGQLHASGLHCHGRIVLNLWRLLRSELKLRIYTFESCVAAVLQLRTPHVPAWVLAQWFNNGPAGAVLQKPHEASLMSTLELTLFFRSIMQPLSLYPIPLTKRYGAT